MTPSAVTYRLRTLGRVELARPDGTSVDSVLSRSKRLALLIYLAVSPGAFCRRDTVLGIFWPEFDQERARAALRKAVHFLRQELGDGVIIARGYEEIGIDLGRLSCDVTDFEAALQNGEFQTALKVYADDFLESFYVSDAPEFTHWAEATRSQLRKQAVQAADRLTLRALEAPDMMAAVRSAGEWVRLAPLDEAAGRALMIALDENSEPAKALEAYRELATRLNEIDLQPSAETQSLERRLRRNNAESRASVPKSDFEAMHNTHPRPSPQHPLVAAAETQPEGPEAATTVSVIREREAGRLPRGSSTRVKVMGAVLIIVSLAAASVFASRQRGGEQSRVEVDPPRVAVLPFVNRTGDQELDGLGKLAAEELTNGLAQVRLWFGVGFRIGDLKAVPMAEIRRVLATTTGQGAARPNSYDPAVAAAVQADFLVTGSYSLRYDSLHFRAAVSDVREQRNTPAPRLTSGPASNPSAVIAELRNHVMGAVAHAATAGAWLYMTPEAPSYEAYQAWAEGLQALGRGQFAEAEASHRRAIALAPGFSRAYWTFGYGALYNQHKWATIDSVAEAMTRTAAPMNVAHRAIRDGLAAVVRGNVLQVYRAVGQLTEIVPNGPNWFDKGYWAVAANYPRAGVEAQMRVLDSTPGFAKQWWPTWDLLTDGLHLMGEHERELEIAKRAEVELLEQSALSLLVKSFAALGQVHETERLAEEALNVGRLGPFVDGAAELRRHGHRAASDSMLVKFVDVLGHRDGDIPVRLMADALMMLGRPREAQAILEGVKPDARSIGITGRLGLVYAIAGDPVGAHRVADELAALSDPYLFGTNTIWRAKIAAVLGDKARAVDLLRATFSEGYTMPRGGPQRMRRVFHRDPAFEILWDYEPYQEFMRPKG